MKSRMTPSEQTTHWIQSFVIHLNLCPFAKHVMDKNAVRIEVSAAPSVEQALTDLKAEIELLNTNAAIDTSFLVFPSFLSDFFDYLDFVDFAQTKLMDNYEGIYQLATFHPDYCFADEVVDDVTNYTNRSPYPMLHLLREDSLDKAIAFYGDTDSIVENNKACLRNLGLEAVKRF
jgi:hypothetical protein